MIAPAAQLSTFFVAGLLAGALAQPGEAPPGMLLVPGGRTKIGITLDELKRILSNDPNSQNYAGALSAETPQHEVVVDSFYAMPTEVTNEQYAAYVRATHAKPPQSWGEAPIRAAAEEFRKEQLKAQGDATTLNLPVPEPASFDPRVWWDANWVGATWEVPAGDERRPVVFVDFTMASRYSRWAGLRLPTEEEYERAVRGDADRRYAWGDAWDNDKFAATVLLSKKGGPFVVGSFPAGASKQGLMDLSGNVWEWTQSRFVAYAGYDGKVFPFGYGPKVRQVNAFAAFDETRRVVVGGSFQNGNLMARASTRRDAPPKTATEALGFRCARTPRMGVDAATSVLEEELTEVWRPRENEGMVVYDASAATAAEQWNSASLAELPGQNLVPGYAVITAHEEIVWCPVKLLRAIDPGTWERLCQQEGPVQVGFLVTSVPLLDPELAAGVYLVSYRLKGLPRFLSTEKPEKRLGKEGSEGAPLEEVLKIDIRYDHLIFSDLHGVPLRALRASIEYGPYKDSRIEIAERDGKRVAHLAASIASKTSMKGLLFDLDLVAEPGRLDGVWEQEAKLK